MANGYPPGWEPGDNRPVIASRHLGDFKYVEITYDNDEQRYKVSLVDCDGPRFVQPRGFYADLGKAFKRGEEL